MIFESIALNANPERRWQRGQTFHVCDRLKQLLESSCRNQVVAQMQLMDTDRSSETTNWILQQLANCACRRDLVAKELDPLYRSLVRNKKSDQCLSTMITKTIVAEINK